MGIRVISLMHVLLRKLQITRKIRANRTFGTNEVNNSPAPMHAPSPPTDGFGAGIFPE